MAPRDGSLAICEQFRAKDPRVVVISKENEGLSLTRNAGMRTAHGKYLQFVDSDDYIEPTFTARMVEAAEKNYADLVIAPYWMVIPLASSKSGRRTEKLLAQLGVQTDTAEPEVNVYSFLPAGNYGQKEFMQEYMKKPSSFYFNVVWNKLYRRSLLMNAGALVHPRSLQRGSAVQCAVFPAGEGLYRPCRPGLLLHPKPPEPAAHQCRP